MSAVEAPAGAAGSPSGPVVAIVPAKDRADSIGATVRSLLAVDTIDRLVVVDDGSSDGTADAAVRAFGESGDDGVARGRVIRLGRNRGKGGAVTAAIEATPDAGIYLLIDADLGDTAGIASALLGPVLAGDADMTIGIPTTAAGSRGGLGKVKQLAAAGIHRASGFMTSTPLSGQRAIRAEVLRSVRLADRFGLETALTIDVVRAGHRVVEVPVDFEHRHTGRSLAGFVHRGRQGADIVRALWSRRTSPLQRRSLVAGSAVLLVLVAVLMSSGWEPNSVGRSRRYDKVVVFGMTRVSLADLGSGDTPNLDRLVRQGAFAASSVRTMSARPNTPEAYASLGASARVRAGDAAADAYGRDDKVGLLTAAQTGELKTGFPVRGDVVVTGLAETRRMGTGKFLPSEAGALGDALHAAGLTTGVVNNTDYGLVDEDPKAMLQRPAAVALADEAGSVDRGDVSTDLVRLEPSRPWGVTTDTRRFVTAARKTIAATDVTVLDPGDLDRAFSFKPQTTDDQFEVLRRRALRKTDAILGSVVRSLPPRTLLIVQGIRPPTGTWELTPVVLWGPGVPAGYLHSPSTRRLGLVTLTDVAPTILDAFGVERAEGMIGQAFRYHPVDGGASVQRMRDLNDLSAFRERIYLPNTKGYVIFQAIIYLLMILLFSSRGGVGPARRLLEWIALAIAAWPLATFVLRMIPHVWVLGVFGGPMIIVLALLITAVVREVAHRHPLSALSWILLGTSALITLDVMFGARLQQASVLGYSPHTAARFTGLGNAAFAALASTTVLWAAIHVQYAPRRREALLGASAVCAVVFLADGAPMLGSDVGGILTFVPVFGLLLYVLWGKRLNLRAIVLSGLATLGVLAVATGLDLLRPADSRTHLGRFVSDIGTNGGGTFFTTIGRKLATNVRVLTGSFWTWIVPILVIVLLFFLVVQRGWERDMPRGSALRAGVVAVLLCGLVGFSVNDSGAVVAALVFVYMGPYVMLLALARSDEPVDVPLDVPPVVSSPSPDSAVPGAVAR